jgi:hypothetical protein
MDNNGMVAAAAVANSDGKGQKDSDAEILVLAKKRWQMANDAYSDSRESELDDLKFLAGSPDNQWQWPQQVLTARTSGNGSTINARPCLTINKLPQHVLQVTNQQRQDRPSGKVIPVNDEASVEVAEVFEGLVRHIEYISDSDMVYNTACENQVATGEGYWRYITEFVDETSFDQEIRITRIKNQFSVFMDPTAQDPCGFDAQWCLITEDLTKEEFEHQYPDATPVTQWQPQSVGDQGMASWLTGETVRIAEYFYVERKKKTLLLYPGGVTAFEGSPEAKAAEAYGLIPARKRQSEKRKVYWCKLNGNEILDKKEWAGRYIPVVRVIGNEYEIEGRIYISGLVRNAKDAQRMYNYWTSQEAEMLALAPKAPFIGVTGQFEGHEDKWKTANIQNWPYLEYNAVLEGDQLVPPPQRVAPPMPQAGLIQAKMGASDDIKSTTGQYDASLGQQGNETSGKAIFAREKQSDTGTFHYHDNFGAALRYGTRILLDLIPQIYDTKRVARIIGLDGDTSHVQIDPEQQQPVVSIRDERTGAAIQKIYNLGVGKYDVAVSTGPGYATKRQEAVENMGLLIQTSPQLWNVIGDLLVKNMDWPGSQEMSKRLRAMVPPDVLAAGEGDDDAPKVAQLKKEMEERDKIIQAQQSMLDNVQKSIEAQKAENDRFKGDVQAYEAETRRLATLDSIAMNEGRMTEMIQNVIKQMVPDSVSIQEQPGNDGAEFEQQPVGMGAPMQPQGMEMAQ